MNRYVTTTEAAKILGKHPVTLAQWRCWNRGPRFTKAGNRVFYRRSDLSKWKRRTS